MIKTLYNILCAILFSFIVYMAVNDYLFYKNDKFLAERLAEQIREERRICAKQVFIGHVYDDNGNDLGVYDWSYKN